MVIGEIGPVVMYDPLVGLVISLVFDVRLSCLVLMERIPALLVLYGCSMISWS